MLLKNIVTCISMTVCILYIGCDLWSDPSGGERQLPPNDSFICPYDALLNTQKTITEIEEEHDIPREDIKFKYEEELYFEYKYKGKLQRRSISSRVSSESREDIDDVVKAHAQSACYKLEILAKNDTIPFKERMDLVDSIMKEFLSVLDFAGHTDIENTKSKRSDKLNKPCNPYIEIFSSEPSQITLSKEKFSQTSMNIHIEPLNPTAVVETGTNYGIIRNFSEENGILLIERSSLPDQVQMLDMLISVSVYGSQGKEKKVCEFEWPSEISVYTTKINDV